MSSIFHSKSNKKFAFASISSAAALALLLTGCGNTENTAHTEAATASASTSASSSASASAASSATESAKPADAAASSTSSATETATEEKPAAEADKAAAADGQQSKKQAKANAPGDYEGVPGAEAMKSAKTVELTDKRVKDTEKLYTEYNNVLHNVKLEDANAEAAAEAEPGAPVSSQKVLPQKTIDRIKAVSTAEAADEFMSSALEFGMSGWQQTGMTKFVGSPRIAETKYNGKDARLIEVCVDSSKVNVKNSVDHQLNSDTAPDRSLNLFTMVQEDGIWKVAATSMPNNTDC